MGGGGNKNKKYSIEKLGSEMWGGEYQKKKDGGYRIGTSRI